MSDTEKQQILRLLTSREQKERLDGLHLALSSPAPEFFTPVINCMTDTLTEVKKAAVKALGAIVNDEASNPLVVEYTQTKDSELKIQIILALRQIRSVKSMKSLCKVFEFESDTELKIMVISGMKIFPPDAISDWLLALLDMEERIADESARILGETNIDALVKRAVPELKTDGLNKMRFLKMLSQVGSYKECTCCESLIHILQECFSDPNSAIREISARILGKLNNTPILDFYAKGLTDSEPAVRLATLSGMYNLKRCWFDDIKKMLSDTDKNVRSEAVAIIHLICTLEKIPELLPLLDSQYLEARQTVVKLIGNFEYPDASLDIQKKLIQMLDIERDIEMIVEIIYSLCFILDEDLTDALAEKFMEYDVKTRSSFIVKCQKEKKLKPVNFLFHIYKREQDEKLRAWIVAILGEIGTKEIVILLKEILKDPVPRVRANAIEAIDRISSDEESIAIILPLLKDFNNRVKANVAMALWQRGGLRMLSLLEEMLLSNDDELHRASAAFSIGEIKAIQSINVLNRAMIDPSPLVRANVIRALGKINDKNSIEMMKNIYSAEHHLVQEHIILALGKMNDVDSFDMIVSALDSPHKNVSIAAKISLKLLKNEKFELPVANYIKKCNNIVTRIFLAKYLGDIGTEKSFDILKNLCQDDDIETQQIAQAAIDKIKSKLIK